MSTTDFIKTFYEFALRAQEKTGISAIFILAQAALETGYGKSVKGNNFFGIKAKQSTPASNKALVRTREVLKDANQSHKFPKVYSIQKRIDGKYTYDVLDYFMVYNTPEESFIGHCNFFFENKRYVNALLVKENPYKFAKAIAKAGYATDPNYADILKQICKTVEKQIK